MPEFKVITQENIREVDIRTIYVWRFRIYIKNFSTNSSPSYVEHKEYLSGELINTNIRWYGIIDKERLVACCSTEQTKVKEGEAIYTLGRVMVDPKRRREKLGSIIIEKCINYTKEEQPTCKIKLEVLKSNTAALRLYEKKGFKCVSEEKNTIYMEKIE